MKPIVCVKCEKEQIRLFNELVDCQFEYEPIYNCYRCIQPLCPYCGQEFEDMLCYSMCGCD